MRKLQALKVGVFIFTMPAILAGLGAVGNLLIDLPL